MSGHHGDGAPGRSADFPLTDWFHVRRLDEGVHLIAEPGHVNCYLVEGEDRAVLLDTGLGIANIRAVAERLCGKPLEVINTHYHFDHSGGNHLFDRVAIHRSGADLLQQPVPEGLAQGYMAYVERMTAAWGDYKHADDVYFHLLTAERLLRPLPADFDPATYAIVRTTPTRLLDDGEEIDLGGRRLRVLHTPGHSPDSICLLDEHHGLLFGGDTINTGPIYAQLEDSDLEAFAASTRRLADLSSTVSRVFVCHFMRLDNPSSLLREVADGFTRILAGDASYRDNVDCLEYPVREACFDNFSVFVPGAAGGTRV